MKFPVFNKQISWYAIRLDKLNTISQKDAHSKLYPASSFKVFIAASLLQDDTINLETIIKLPESNPSTDLFPINLKTLHAGKTGTISEFIFSMLQDSDNRASNALADLTDTEKLSRDQRYDDTGITQIFKDNKKCMYSQRLETSAYDLAMFAANLENSNNEYYKTQMKKHLLGPDKPGALKNSKWHKSGDMVTMPNKDVKFLRKFYQVKYRSEVAIIEYNNMKYAIGILSRRNTIKGSNQEINLSKIEKFFEKQFLKQK